MPDMVLIIALQMFSHLIFKNLTKTHIITPIFFTSANRESEVKLTCPRSRG